MKVKFVENEVLQLMELKVCNIYSFDKNAYVSFYLLPCIWQFIFNSMLIASDVNKCNDNNYHNMPCVLDVLAKTLTFVAYLPEMYHISQLVYWKK